MENVKSPLKEGKKTPQKRGRKPKSWHLSNEGKEPVINSSRKNSSIGSKSWVIPGTKSPGGSRPPGHLLPLAPHQLTTKDILDLVFLDHNYCQVLYSTNRSKVQPFRHLFGPKDEYKANFYPETLISPNKFLPPVPPPPQPPPVTSKLEYLLKRGNASSPAPNLAKRCATPTKRYWDVHEEIQIDVDVLSPLPQPSIPYDAVKARNLMTQCEKHALVIKPVDVLDDWEDHIVRTGWTDEQEELFDTVIKALDSERLARLAYIRHPAEPVLRRASLDRTARRIRGVMNQFKWDTRLTQWLHGILIENLSQAYLAAYLDVLQTLKSKAPKLIDRMIVLSTTNVEDPEPLPNIDHPINNPNPSADGVAVNSEMALNPNSTVGVSPADALKEVLFKKTNTISADALNLLLKKPWDPFSPVVHHNKLKKLACNPVFLYIPCGSLSTCPSSVKRFKNLCTMLSALGKVVALNLRHSMTRKLSVSRYASKILLATKTRIEDLRKSHPDRPLYLVGWGTGAIIATTASVNHVVAGVIALAFPLFGLSGPRGTLEDPILDMRHPVLFVIGGRSADVNLSDMELLRKQLNCESSMVIIGCGNEDLQISRYHREKLLVTQSFVDKSIIDEISYFINLHSKHQQVTAAVVMEKSSVSVKQSGRKVTAAPRRARTESASSSISMEDLKSPTLHINRPEGSMDGIVTETSCNDSLISQPKISPIVAVKKRKAPRRPSSNTRATDQIGLATQSSTITSLLLQPSPGGKGTAGTSASQGPIMVSDSTSDINSPVLNYLGKPSGQQSGVLQGLLSPTSFKTSPSSDIILQSPVVPLLQVSASGSGTGKKTKIGEGEKKKRPSKPKAPKKSLNTPVMSPADKIGATVLAGGATATPVPLPVNPSADSMRQYVIQHQQVIQQHLQQYQQQQPAQSQLLRLLTPPTSAIPPSTSSGSYNIPMPRSTESPKPTRFGGAEIFDAGPPANVSVIPISSSESKISPNSSIKSETIRSDLPRYPPPTALISREQLMSNLSMPMVRLPWIDPSSTSVMGFQQQQAVPMPNFTADAKANVVFKAADKTIATNLRQVDLKALFDGGVVRFVVPGESGQRIPVNIILKHPMISTTTTTFSGSNIIQSTPGVNANVSLSTVQQFQPLSTVQYTPQSVPARPDVSQFGKLVRSPVDSSGFSNPQVPVSVLMPKTFVPTATIMSKGVDIIRANSASKITQEELQNQKVALQNLHTTVASVVPSPQYQQPKVTATPQPITSASTFSVDLIKGVKSLPIPVDIPKLVIETKNENIKSSPTVIKHVPTETKVVPTVETATHKISQISSESVSQKDKLNQETKIGPTTKEIDTKANAAVITGPKLKLDLPSSNKTEIHIQAPVSEHPKSCKKFQQDKTGTDEKSRSLRPKSYPAKRKIQATGSHVQNEVRKKLKPVLAIESPTVAEAPAESLRVSLASEPKTPKKKEGKRVSGSSEDNEGDSSTPRLTRSMRRQSSNSGGT